MNSLGILSSRLGSLVAGYGSQELGAFYARDGNQLFLYLSQTAFLMIAGLLALALYQGPAILVRQMAFSTIYTLHSALAYVICHWLVDWLAARTWPAWGGPAQRNVTRQWLIWSGGFLCGFALQRGLAPCLMHLYAGDLIAYLLDHQIPRPPHAAVFIYTLPFWAAAVFLSVRLALRNQTVEFAIVPPAPAGIIRPQPAQPEPPAASPRQVPTAWLEVVIEGSTTRISLKNLAYITVEDHYVRLCLVGQRGRRDLLIRASLADLLAKLPPERFTQIHRSHVVNLDFVTGLKRAGRQAKVILAADGIALPVSRQRMASLRDRIPHAREEPCNTSG